MITLCVDWGCTDMNILADTIFDIYFAVMADNRYLPISINVLMLKI